MSKVAFFIALCASCFSTVLSHGNEARLTHTLYIDSETYREFSYDELVDCFRNFCLCRDGFGRDYVYQWLQLMKLDRNKLHRALMQVYGDMCALAASADANVEKSHTAVIGKRRLLLFLGFCVDDNDAEMLTKIYSNPAEDLRVRVNAVFARLLSADTNKIKLIVGNIPDISRGNVHSRHLMYLDVQEVSLWTTMEKRVAIVDALKEVCVHEDSKFMFGVLDDIFKCLDNSYAKSQFRRDFIKQFLVTPFSEKEISAKIKDEFDEAMNECFNEDAEVKPLRYVPRTYGPFISYDESILGITPRQRRIRTLARVAVYAAVVAVMAAVIVCFVSKRRKNR